MEHCAGDDHLTSAREALFPEVSRCLYDTGGHQIQRARHPERGDIDEIEGQWPLPGNPEIPAGAVDETEVHGPIKAYAFDRHDGKEKRSRAINTDQHDA